MRFPVRLVGTRISSTVFIVVPTHGDSSHPSAIFNTECPHIAFASLKLGGAWIFAYFCVDL
jgi:hypothetical protein